MVKNERCKGKAGDVAGIFAHVDRVGRVLEYWEGGMLFFFVPKVMAAGGDGGEMDGNCGEIILYLSITRLRRRPMPPQGKEKGKERGKREPNKRLSFFFFYFLLTKRDAE